MNEVSAGTLEAIYLATIAGATALLVWNGWRQGILRQLMTLLALVGAYLAGWYGAEAATPLFEFLRYPAPITHVIAGLAVGAATFIGVRTLRVLWFKKTSQLAPGARQLSFGLLGAFMGLIFGGVLLLFTTDALRLLGAIASTHVRSTEQQKQALQEDPDAAKMPPPEEPNALVRGLAKLGNAIEQSDTGKFLEKYDPVPKNVYATVAKLALVVSNSESLDRFRDYPGVKRLIEHPKLLALYEDPGVNELLAHGSYLKLLRHEKVIALAGDAEFAAEIKKVDFEHALDSALREKPPSLELPEP